MSTKAQIIEEIRKTAAKNGGSPLGSARFEAETGIRYGDWFGIHWARWGDALREAGFEPNQLQGAYDKAELILRYAELARELGRLPSYGDLGVRRRTNRAFPSSKTFNRLGKKADLIRQVRDFSSSQPGFEQVTRQCEDYLASSAPAGDDESETDEPAIGYVYLLKHGSRREYKIGRTYNRLRREGEIAIELPERIEPIHVIETDDPAGVEAYWHRRFDAKRLNSEWFELSADDVRAFKRWRIV